MTGASAGCGITDAHAAAPSIPIKRALRIGGPHRVLETTEGFLYFRIAMGSGHERRLERRGCQVNSATQGCMEESFEHLCVTPLCGIEIDDRSVMKEVAP